MVIHKIVSREIYVAHLRNRVKLGCYAESPDRFGLVVGIYPLLLYLILSPKNDNRMVKPITAIIGSSAFVICSHYIIASSPYLEYDKIDNQIMHRKWVAIF